MKTCTTLFAAVLMVATCYSQIKQPVRIDSGLVSGVLGRDPSITAFKGIPYAEPPVGNLRWAEPLRATRGNDPAPKRIAWIYEMAISHSLAGSHPPNIVFAGGTDPDQFFSFRNLTHRAKNLQPELMFRLRSQFRVLAMPKPLEVPTGSIASSCRLRASLVSANTPSRIATSATLHTQAAESADACQPD